MIKQRTLKEEILSDRQRKNIRILELIGKRGPMTKTYISKSLKINIVTASNYVRHFINRDIVFETGLDSSSGGRKPALVGLNYKSGYVIGVSLDSRFNRISAVLTDYGVRVCKKKSCSWDPQNRSKEVIERVADMIDSILTEMDVKIDKITAIGVSLPVIIDERGETVKWNTSFGNMNIYVSISVRTFLEKRFRIPIFIERNDLVALAGERWLNLNSDIQNVLFMNSDISCSYIIRGQLYRGSSGLAGFLGTVQQEKEKDSPLGFEQSSYDLYICETVKKRIKNGENSLLKSDDKIDLKSIIEMAHQGDSLIIDVIQKAGNLFGKKISFLANLLNPEAVIIGGGLEKIGPILLDSIRKSIKVYALEEVSNVIKVIPSTLNEDLLSLGSASLVLQEIFSQI